MRFLHSFVFAALLPGFAVAADYVLPGEMAERAVRDPERFQEQMIQHLFRVSPDGRLTQEQADIYHQRARAQARASARQRWWIHDLDGDGTISQDEVRKLRLVMPTRERAEFEGLFLKADANSDGALSQKEINTAADATITRFHREEPLAKNLQSLDFDGDSIVTVEDIVAALATLKNSSIGQSHALERAGCNLPKPSPEAEIVMFGAYEGAAVSTVAVAGMDEETSLGVLEIEPGDAPLYIVVSVYDAMVLRFTGATDRVERLVGSSYKSLGVVGLPKDRVTFAPRDACRLKYFDKKDAAAANQVRAMLTSHLGRAPDRIVTSYDIGRSRLPSGRPAEASTKPKKSGVTIIQGNRRIQLTEDGIVELDVESTAVATRNELLRFYPAGIATVMPEDVVTLAGDAKAYDVLPQQAGLLQLQDSGAIRLLERGVYAIEKPIVRFPAGLNGAHSVQFILRKGVPMPGGSPGHSSVLIEETGECIGARCRQ